MFHPASPLVCSLQEYFHVPRPSAQGRITRAELALAVLCLRGGATGGVPGLADLAGSQPGADIERRRYYSVLQAAGGNVQHIIFWDTFPERVSSRYLEH